MPQGRRKLVPPLNFSPVEKQLYRSGEPSQTNFEFLDTLHLRTIIWLATEDPNSAFEDWADEKGIVFEHLGLLAEDARPWDQLTDDTIAAALDMILDVSNYPILICDGMGRHRTGTVIGCLRKLQNWSFASLIDEYQRSAGIKGERVGVELQIESFNPGQVLVPANAPIWYKGSR